MNFNKSLKKPSRSLLYKRVLNYMTCNLKICASVFFLFMKASGHPAHQLLGIAVTLVYF